MPDDDKIHRAATIDEAFRLMLAFLAALLRAMPSDVVHIASRVVRVSGDRPPLATLQDLVRAAREDVANLVRERRPRTLADLTPTERAALATKIRDTAKDADERSRRMIEIRVDHQREEQKTPIIGATPAHTDRGFLLSEVDVLTERLVDEAALRVRAERERDEIAQRLSNLQAAVLATSPDPKREAWIVELAQRATSAAQAKNAPADLRTPHLAALDRHVEIGMLAGFIDDAGNPSTPTDLLADIGERIAFCADCKAAQPSLVPHILAALRRVRDAATPGDSGKHLLTQIISQVEGAAQMAATGRHAAAIEILNDIEPARCDEESNR